MKKISTILLSALFFVSIGLNHAYALSYVQGGAKNPSGLATLSIESPLHTGWQAQTITGVYNEPRSGEFHRGVDYSTYDSSKGNYLREVYPIADGTIYGTGTASDGNKYVILKHVRGTTTWYSTYMHLNSIAITTSGTSVTKNTQIGVSGNSGGVAYHLHWEVNTSSSTTLSTSRITVDPYPYMYNTYGFGTYTNDHTLVKFVNYNESTGTLQATIYGIYNGSRTAPSSTPKAYWKYNDQTTWTAATGTSLGSNIYSFSIPANSSKSYVEYIIYVRGTWYNGTTSYDTHWNAVYNDAAESPGSWTSSASNAAERYDF